MSIEPPAQILASRLPTGRHGLPREAVLANQRRRLLAATALAVVEVGYGDLTVQDITSRAQISRVTFYQLFERKADCLLAAFDQALEDLLAALAGACSAQRRWPQSVIVAVGAAVDFAIASPAEAGLLSVGAFEPELAPRARDANLRLAKMLAEARPTAEGEGPLPAITEELLIGGAGSVIAARLAAEDGSAALAALAPQLAELILAPYLGAAEAGRLIGSSGAGGA